MISRHDRGVITIQFQAHKSFYIFVGIASIAASIVFMAVSAAYTGGAIQAPDPAQSALQFAIMGGIVLVIGIVGIAMLFKRGTGLVFGLALLGNGLWFLVFFDGPYTAMIGDVTLSVGIIAIIFQLCFYRFVHWRLSFESGSLTTRGVSQTLGFYGLPAVIFFLLGLLGYYVLLDAPPFPL